VFSNVSRRDIFVPTPSLTGISSSETSKAQSNRSCDWSS